MTDPSYYSLNVSTRKVTGPFRSAVSDVEVLRHRKLLETLLTAEKPGGYTPLPEKYGRHTVATAQAIDGALTVSIFALPPGAEEPVLQATFVMAASRAASRRAWESTDFLKMFSVQPPPVPWVACRFGPKGQPAQGAAAFARLEALLAWAWFEMPEANDTAGATPISVAKLHQTTRNTLLAHRLPVKPFDEAMIWLPTVVGSPAPVPTPWHADLFLKARKHDGLLCRIYRDGREIMFFAIARDPEERVPVWKAFHTAENTRPVGDLPPVPYAVTTLLDKSAPRPVRLMDERAWDIQNLIVCAWVQAAASASAAA